MIAQVWKKLEFGKQKLKEKYLGKLFVKDRNEKQYKSPNFSIFFDFSKNSKTIKIDLLKL